eukprot:6524325-Prymnesium_polylepis.1
MRQPETMHPELTRVSIATKLIADLRPTAHRGRARSRLAAGLPAAPAERAPESHLSGLRASNT